MFELLFLNIEKQKKVQLFFLLNFFLLLVLGVINNFIGSNFLILICLSSILITYPIVSFLFREYFFSKQTNKNFNMKRFLQIELYDIWLLVSFFLSCFFAFLILLYLNLIKDVSYILNIVQNLSGNFIFFEKPFFEILINNLIVAFFSFLISFITSSGFIFVLIFNSAIFSIFIYEAGKGGFALFFLIFPHAFFEISGFILAGIFGFILSQKILYFFNKSLTLKINQSNFETFLVLILSILCIFIGAIIEIL